MTHKPYADTSSRTERRFGKTHKPNWNFRARWFLFYLLPAVALWMAVVKIDDLPTSGDFWIVTLWAFWMPYFNGTFSPIPGNKKFVFRNFNDEESIQLGTCILHGAIWILLLEYAPIPWLSPVLFFLFFLFYDYLLIRYELLHMYIIPKQLWNSSPLVKVLIMGSVWWGYLSFGLWICHLYVPSDPLAILVATFALICPMQIYLSVGNHRLVRRYKLKRIAVIGAGWSGIYAAKWLKEKGLEVEVFEKNNCYGGIWKYSGQQAVGVHASTVATSSKYYLHASDFSLPLSYPIFPSHAQIFEFLKSYVDHFGLAPLFSLRHLVKDIVRTPTGWEVKGLDGDKRPFSKEFDATVVCAGTHQIPTQWESKYSNFTGKIMHSSAYKNPSTLESYRRILVVGLGESAADIAYEVGKRDDKEVYWSGSNGHWFAGRLVGGGYAADVYMAPGIRSLFSRFLHLETLGRKFISKYMHIMWGKGGTGIKAWVPTGIPWLHSFVTKSREAVELIYQQKIIALPAITHTDGSKVNFEDGRSYDIDLIIDCSGFDIKYPFLRNGMGPKNCYQLVFDPRDPMLSFAGSARPTLGAIPSLAELQARWIASVYSGEVPLPSSYQMKAEEWYTRTIHNYRFPKSLKRPNMVDHELYARRLARYCRVQVPMLFFLLTRPKVLWIWLNSPWMAFKYNLRNKETRKEAIKHLLMNQPPVESPFYSFVGILIRTGFILLVPVLVALFFLVKTIPLYISLTFLTMILSVPIAERLVSKSSR